MILAHATQRDGGDVLVIALTPGELTFLMNGGCLSRTSAESDALPAGWSLGIIGGGGDPLTALALRELLSDTEPLESDAGEGPDPGERQGRGKSSAAQRKEKTGPGAEEQP